MKILYVRGLSEAAREVLEREAEQAHRSLSAQIVTILEQYVKTSTPEGIDKQFENAFQVADYIHKVIGKQS